MFDLNNKYVQKILDCYSDWAPLEHTSSIGFDGTANAQNKGTIFTPEISNDQLVFGGYLDFSNASVTVRIISVSPNYEWMSNSDQVPLDTPTPAIFGVLTQVEPVRPLILPVFLYAHGRLKMSFTNPAGSASPSGGTVTWHGLRLLDPINGGYHPREA